MSSSWTDRIKNYEADPPPRGWEKVVASLDESFTGYQFPVTLYNFEEVPPSATWNKIQSSLDEEETPVIPINKIKPASSLLRYAVAASIIGILVFGATRYFKIGTDKIDVALSPAISPSKTDTPSVTDKTQPNSTQATQPEDDKIENLPEPGKDTYASLDIHSRNLSSKLNRSLYRSPAQPANFYSEAALHNNLELQYPHRAAVNDSPSDNSSGRYLMFKNSDGQFIRISKKLSDLFCCVSGEERDENCDDQLKKWREKIAASSFIPSPDNFMDILDLVSSLQDNRN